MASDCVNLPTQQLIIQSPIARGQWSSELCDCCMYSNGPLGFFTSWLFPFFYYGSINGVLDPRADSTPCAGNFGKSCLFYWLFMLVGQALQYCVYLPQPCGTTSAVFLTLYAIFNPNAIMLMKMRLAIMKRFGIQSNACTDCLISYFCCCCSMSQMKAELENRIQTGEFVPYPTEGFKLTFTATTAPMQQVVMAAPPSQGMPMAQPTPVTMAKPGNQRT